MDEQPATEIPRLSPSIAKIMINRSPRHAYHEHRLLGGGGDDESTKSQDTGKILEALVYNQPMDNFVILDFEDYKTKAAKEARDSARDERKTPILLKDYSVHQAAAFVIRKQLRDEYGVEFKGGEYQKLVEWQCASTDALCKGYLDYFTLSTARIEDLKAVADAHPKRVQRSFVDYGWDIAYAAYLDGIQTMYPDLAGRASMVFWFAETSPPYYTVAYEPDGEMAMMGAEKWHRAKRLWVECMASGVWPGYFRGVGRISPTPWQLAEIQWEEE